MNRGEARVDVYAKWKSLYGDFCHYWIGPFRFYMVSRLDIIQHIYSNRQIYETSDFGKRIFGLQVPSGLISLRGAEYKRHARIMLPMFKKAKVACHLNSIIDCTDRLIQYWRQQDKTLNENIVSESKHLLLDIFAFIAFDYD
ncbi:unnamed protein product, partial [Didymodactylos carnosus]